ncbi:MAG: ComF family protein [Thermoleophilia bacterium]|nr:ComF family protein [Thermoleophilia bacterium]
MYARALSRRLEVPLRDILTKHRLTTPQNRLDFDQRRKNLIGSFSLKPDVRLDGSVVLIDDVYTTGSTAAECAGMIREGLGVDVYVWTFARTVKRQESSSTT